MSNRGITRFSSRNHQNASHSTMIPWITRFYVIVGAIFPSMVIGKHRIVTQPTLIQKSTSTNVAMNNRTAIEKPKRVRDGCNFSDSTVNGILPFSQTGKGTLCTIHLDKNSSGFLYYCEGISHPPECPRYINHLYGVHSLGAFFEQGSIEESDNPRSHGMVYVAYFNKPLQYFEGMCICHRYDGTKMTMRISSGFLQPCLPFFFGLFSSAIWSIT